MKVVKVGFLILFICSCVSAATIRVPQDQATIQAGINAAANGDTVLVAPGVHSGKFSVINKAVFVRSSGGAEVTFLEWGLGNGTQILFSNATGGSLEGFEIRDESFTTSEAIVLNNASINILKNRFINLGSYSDFLLIGGDFPSVVEVRENIFARITAENAMLLVLGGAVADITNNTIYNTRRGVVTYTNGSKVKNNVISHCFHYGYYNGSYTVEENFNCFWGNLSNRYDGGAVNATDVLQNPLFEDESINDFRLATDSPCINAGDPSPSYNDSDGSRNDIGARITGKSKLGDLPDTLFFSYSLWFYPTYEMAQCISLCNVGTATLNWATTILGSLEFAPSVCSGYDQLCCGCDDQVQSIGVIPPQKCDCIKLSASWLLPSGGGYTANVIVANLDEPSDVDTITVIVQEDVPIDPCLTYDVIGQGGGSAFHTSDQVELNIRVGGPLPDTVYVELTSTELPPMDWVATHIDPEIPWLSFSADESQSSTVDTAKFWVNENAFDLMPGQYSASARLGCYSCECYGGAWNYVDLRFNLNTIEYQNAYVSCDNGNDNKSGTLLNPFRTIAHAIATVDTSDTVFVFPGECQQTVIIAKPVNLISLEGPDVTTIRGVPGYRCIFVDGVVEDTVRIEGFTITGGSPNQLDDLYYNGGGGILAHYSLVSIDNCVVVDNVAETSGGGILFRKNTDFRLTNSTVCHNRSLTSSGGGVATVDAAGGTITRTAISGNNAALNGGGVFFWGGTPEYYGRNLVMANNVVVSNLATEGGAGIGARRADLDLRNNIVVNNQRASGVNPLFGVYASESSLVTTNNYNGVFANVGGLNYSPGIVVGTHSLSAAPQFTGDTACVSFALDPCSPFVDRGDPSIAPLPSGGAQSDIGLTDISAEDCEYRLNRVWVGPINYIDCNRLSVPVWFVNEVDVIAAITVPLLWTSSQIVYDSIRWQGSRVDNWEVNLATANNANRTLLIGATRFEAAPASPDSGLLCQLFFHSQGLLEGANVCFDTTFIPPGGEFVFADIEARTLYPSYQTHCFDFAPPCARVNIPNGGELYVGHNIEMLAWKLLSDEVDSTVVRLSTDGGATFSSVVQTVNGPDTSLAWYVPVLWEEDCRIQVTQYRPGGIVEQDQSDEMFTLHSIADVDCSNQLNIVDVLCLINYIFPTVTDPCDCIDRAKDVNCDTKFNIVDVVHLVNFIFSGGAGPCPDMPIAGKLTIPTLALATSANEREDAIILSTNSDFELAAVELDLTIPARSVSSVELLNEGTSLQLFWSATSNNAIKIGVIDPTGQSLIGAGATSLIKVNLTDASSDGNYSVSGIAVDREAAEYSFASLTAVSVLPVNYRLEQNQPNPFNPATSIAYSLPMYGHVELTVFNILGNQVRTLVDASMPAGTYVARWDGRSESNEPMPSGVYFCRLKSGSFEETKKMLLLK